MFVNLFLSSSNFINLANDILPNIAIGDSNWPGLGNGNLNIVLGNFNQTSNPTITNTTIIGNSITAYTDNTFYLGSFNQNIQIGNKTRLLSFQSFNSGISGNPTFEAGEFISIGSNSVVTINLPPSVATTQIGAKFQIIRNHTSPVNITIQVSGLGLTMRLPDTSIASTYTWISTESSISVICIASTSPAFQIIENAPIVSTGNFVDLSSTQTILSGAQKTFAGQVYCSVSPSTAASLCRKSYVDGVCTASVLIQSTASTLYPTMSTLLTNPTATQLLNYTNTNFKYNGSTNTLITPSLNFSTNLFNPNKQIYNAQTELTILTGTHTWNYGDNDTLVIRNPTAIINIDVPACSATNLQTRLRIMKPSGAQIYIISIGGTLDIFDENMLAQPNYLMTGSNNYIELSVITDTATNPTWFVSYSQRGNYAISANLVNNQSYVGTPTFNNLTINGNTNVNGNDITPTEISYLTGVTSDIQTQINNTNSSLSNYLTTAAASTTYQTIANMSNYLTTSLASTTYQTISGMSSYLTTAAASTTYQTLADMSNYVTKGTTETITGEKTFTSQIILNSYLYYNSLYYKNRVKTTTLTGGNNVLYVSPYYEYNLINPTVASNVYLPDLSSFPIGHVLRFRRVTTSNGAAVVLFIQTGATINGIPSTNLTATQFIIPRNAITSVSSSTILNGSGTNITYGSVLAQSTTRWAILE